MFCFIYNDNAFFPKDPKHVMILLKISIINVYNHEALNNFKTSYD